MKQYLFLILQGLMIGIGSEIDTGFGNNLGLDSICILSSYLVITWVTYSIYQLGSYAFRVYLGNVRNCIVLQLIVSVVEASVLLLFKGYIVHLYHLTDAQYLLFEKCLFVHAISLPFLALGDFYYNYMVLKCKNKELTITQAIYYMLMLSLDAIVFFRGCDLSDLIITTLISYVVYDILSEILLKVRHEEDPLRVDILKNCAKHGWNITVDRVLGKVAVVTYTVLVSYLGTELYAIHCIGYSIGTLTENVTNQVYNNQIIQLSKIEGIKNKFVACIKDIKKLLPVTAIISYVIGLAMLLVIHGEVSIKSALLPTLVYLFQCIPIQLYEGLRAYLTSIKETKMMQWAGAVGIFVRIPIAILSYKMGSIWGFAIACAVDFGLRGIYFYVCSLRVLNKCGVELV